MRQEMGLYGLIMLIISGTILSTLIINLVILQYGVTNDYVFGTLQNITEDLDDEDMFTNSINITNMTLQAAEGYRDTINWFDNLWLMAYIIFIMITFGLAYQIKRPTDINFFMIMLYGIFIFLFVGYLSQIFIDWFITNVTLKLMPTALEFLPKFQWYIDNAGMINLFHAVILLVISRLNFQFSLRDSINEQEVEYIDEEEIN